jgi:hypothetical protein
MNNNENQQAKLRLKANFDQVLTSSSIKINNPALSFDNIYKQAHEQFSSFTLGIKQRCSDLAINCC